MPNPLAPTEGSGRRVPFTVDPQSPGTAYLAAGRGGIAMGAGRTEGAAAYTLPMPADAASRASVAADDSDLLLLAADPDRLGALVHNASGKALYVGLGAAAVTADDLTAVVAAGGDWAVPAGYTGEVRGCWESGFGGSDAALVTVMTYSGWGS